MKYRRVKFDENLERFYPIKKLNDELSIIGFDYIGDMDLVHNCTNKLINLIPVERVDYVVTTATKGIPLAQNIAEHLNVPYICIRKEEKVYMDKQLKVLGKSITSGNSFYNMSEKEFKLLENKNVIFVDDVYSTGSTIDVVKEFTDIAKAKILGAYFILKEYKGKTRPVRRFGKFYFWLHKKISCASVQAIPLIKNKEVKNDTNN